MEVATLGVNVDSSSAAKATQDLERLAREAGLTEKQIAALRRASLRGFGDGARDANRFANVVGGSGMRNAALQMSQVAQQTAASGNFMRSLAIQLPDLTIGLGTIGIAAGVAAGALLPLIANTLGATNEMQRFIDEANNTQDAYSRVQSAVSAIAEIQREYAETMRRSGGASTALASNVQANSRKEFEARKQVLEVEIEILRIRGEEQRQSLRNLRDQQRAAFEAATIQTPSAQGIIADQLARDTAGQVRLGPRTRAETFPGLNAEAAAERNRAIRKLEADVDLIEVQVDRSTQLLNGEFETIAGGGINASGGGRGGRGGGRGGRGGGRNARQREDIFEASRKQTEALNREIQTIGKTRAEIAQMEAAWKLLDDAKKAGLPISEGLASRIESEAATIGQLTGALEQAQQEQRAFENLNRTIKDGILDMAMSGTNAFDGLANAIKRAAFEFLLFGEGPLAGLSRGVGGGGLFGGLLGSLFGGFRADGGPVQAGRSYVVGERGPELFTPGTSGQITPNGAMGQVTVVVQVEEGQMFRPVVRAEAQGAAVQVVAQNNAAIAERQRR